MPSAAANNNVANDDLFNYDAGLDDLLADAPDQNTADQNNGSNGNNNNNNGNGPGGKSTDLGLDDEIKVTRKRAPVAKLDEGKLLSQNGIPKLRRNAKTKLRLKGKGHEFSDAARLLTFYQLWLDDLYPRAKFADGLTMVEKLGHSKRLQVMRKEWIDEGKAGGINGDAGPAADSEDPHRREDDEQGKGRQGSDRDGMDVGPVGGSDDARETRHGEGPGVSSLFGGGRRRTPDSEDDFDLFVSDPHTNNAGPTSAPTNEVPEEDDDLDALLAETENPGPATTSGPASRPPPPLEPPLDDDFEDDFEAMDMYGV